MPHTHTTFILLYPVSGVECAGLHFICVERYTDTVPGGVSRDRSGVVMGMGYLTCYNYGGNMLNIVTLDTGKQLCNQKMKDDKVTV